MAPQIGFAETHGASHIGLLLLIGAHSVPMSPSLKAALIARLGERPFRVAFWTLSGAGLALIFISYGHFRGSPQDVLPRSPPTWSRDLAYIVMLPALIQLVAAFSPTHIRQLVGGHPLLFSVILWAMTHLIGNGHLAGLLLLGCFLVWALVDLVSACQRKVLRRQAIDPDPAL